MGDIGANVQRVRSLIHMAETTYLRPQNSVKLLCVSKGQTHNAIKQAALAGLYHFGESYVQEALPKMRELQNLPLCWHFIGSIQSNKTLLIAQHFSWVHSVSRIKIAEKLNLERTALMSPLNVCMQINIDDELTKSGIQPKDAIELAIAIQRCRHLRLRGLMVIPKPQQDETLQYLVFKRATDLLNQLNHELNLSMDTLSMGMSHDVISAIRAGSTIVRMGRAIFEEN